MKKILYYIASHLWVSGEVELEVDIASLDEETLRNYLLEYGYTEPKPGHTAWLNQKQRRSAYIESTELI